MALTLESSAGRASVRLNPFECCSASLDIPRRLPSSPGTAHEGALRPAPIVATASCRRAQNQDDRAPTFPRVLRRLIRTDSSRRRLTLFICRRPANFDTLFAMTRGLRKCRFRPDFCPRAPPAVVVNREFPTRVPVEELARGNIARTFRAEKCRRSTRRVQTSASLPQIGVCAGPPASL